MKHTPLFRLSIPALLAVLLLAGCSGAPTAATEPPVTTPIMTEAPTEPVTQSTTEAPTDVPHSELYIPGVPVEDVILYFNEVCLDAEFTNAGDPSVLQKWARPIIYQVNGTPTEDDLETLSVFCQWLNTVEGFPGIREADESESPNLRIHFCKQQEMVQLLGDNFQGMDGGVTFWYLKDKIYDAIICYRTDLDQYLRNSVILEEIYNGLGPVQDTFLRPDSIIYAEFTQPQELTPIDELILRLLYHPLMECGMDAAECEAIIRQLYY